MPLIERFGCDNCDFQYPVGWGSYCYVVDNDGVRQACGHPDEFGEASRITGLPFDEISRQDRFGRLTHCVCLKCTRLFECDFERDDCVCPTCESNDIETAWGMVGETCPVCSHGTIERGSPVRWKLDPDWETLPVPSFTKKLVEACNRRMCADLLSDEVTFLELREQEKAAFFAEFGLQAVAFWWEGFWSDGVLQHEVPLSGTISGLKCLRRVLPFIPELADIIEINAASVRFRQTTSKDERRGINNYVKKHIDRLSMV